MKEFKTRREISTKDLVGNKWYDGFMELNCDLLRRGRCRNKDIKRVSWCRYTNFNNMYDVVNKAMVLAKVAKNWIMK
jgi:hypothetical protein